MPFVLILRKNVWRTALILWYVTFFYERKTEQSIKLGMEYVDEMTLKGFRTCQQHTRIVSILGAVKLLFTFVALNTV